MVNIKDVAKLANVSAATVSRVINNNSSVSEETKKKVNKAIKSLNYQPNMLGINLRRTRTHIVLVLIPNISNVLYAKIVKGIEDVAHKNGYNVMLCNTDSDVDREQIYVDLLKNKLADGIIFMASQLSVKEMNQVSSNYPLVQCCEYRENVNIAHVSVDNYLAAYEATTHLCSLGKKRIALISSQNKFSSTFKREAGYKKAIEDAGIKFNASLIKYGDYSYRKAFQATSQLLDSDKQPDAIFAISDIMAIAAIKAISEKGLNVPHDIAVCGFDDISFSSMFNPPITTISQPTYEMGCVAMELLLKQIRNEGTFKECVIMDHELKIRKTTKL